MDYQIEIYRGSDRRFFATEPFTPIVLKSMERLLRLKLDKAKILITLLELPEDFPLQGSPIVENLVPEYGFTYVKIYLQGLLMYQHPHHISEIITQTLQEQLREKFPDEKKWGFRLDLPGMSTPTTKFSHEILDKHSPPSFTIRRLVEESLPHKTLEDFGVTADFGNAQANVRILLREETYQELCQTRPLSLSVEEGGFLVGNVYQDAQVEGGILLELTTALIAQHTGASLMHFTFTGNSFAEVKQVLRKTQTEERVLGWFHTHLFPAAENFGLSSIDVDLHFRTFSIPWQIAGLINLNNPTGTDRTLRFYRRQGNKMTLCPYTIVHERSRNSH
jgi:JAB N-terminal domain